jgi:tRNA threonylcarbamoyladenosine modification (KEOPS) complex  Pcc1 subunit
MTKINFDDSSYIELESTEDKIRISLAAKDSKNSRATIVNAAELSWEQFKLLVTPELIEKLAHK